MDIKPARLWGLGYQGDQCDLLRRSHRSQHCCCGSVPARVCAGSNGVHRRATRVDIVAHSLGVIVTREWMFQDRSYSMVRSLVAFDDPDHGIIDWSFVGSQ
jgi:hypothetical protein